MCLLCLAQSVGKGRLMSDTDKIVAAIFAAAKVSAMGERPADEYVAEYESFLQVLEKHERTAKAASADHDAWPEVNAELNAELNKELKE
jgi:hypothetical protein